MSSVGAQLRLIWSREGCVGLTRRILARLAQKPVLLILNVWRVDDQSVAEIPPALADVEIRQLCIEDKADVQAIAKTKFYTSTEEQVRERLSEGQLCYIAKLAGQVVSSFWIILTDFYEGYLRRPLYLDGDEVYLLGFYTVPEQRGRNLLPQLISTILRELCRDGRTRRAFAFVRTNNQASTNAVLKLGFRRMGRIGFLQALGVRLHFILGRHALAQRNRRLLFGVP